MELNKSLPSQLKLFNFAKKEISLSGVYQISDLARVSEIASNKTDKININLSFYLDNDKTPCIDGIISLDIVLICQRCLEELNISLKVRFNLAFVRNEKQGEELDSNYEIYVTEEDELATHDLISDEILLAIPMVPTHDYNCIKEINKQAKKHNRIINCLLQAKIAKEDTKFGLSFDEIEAVIGSEEISDLENIKIVGFMGMATFTDNQEQLKKEFLSLKSFFDTQKLRALASNCELKILSMGMSGDYPLAIENGSTMIRVGSSIFGNRNYY